MQQAVCPVGKQDGFFVNLIRVEHRNVDFSLIGDRGVNYVFVSVSDDCVSADEFLGNVKRFSSGGLVVMQAAIALRNSAGCYIRKARSAWD